MINARAETVAVKSIYRKALKRECCRLPGFSSGRKPAGRQFRTIEIYSFL
jgi:putative SOS response-associated peptidase YedK